MGDYPTDLLGWADEMDRVADMCRDEGFSRRIEEGNRALAALLRQSAAEIAALRERVAGEDARCRRIAQGIIETIGSVGPENAEDAAARACAEILCLRERVAVLERVRDAAKDAVNWVDNSEWRYALYLALAAAKPAAQEGKEAADG